MKYNKYFLSSGSCTHTNGAGWWNVDLKDNYVIKSVWIKNRVDCCSNRIEGVQVWICNIITHIIITVAVI